MNISDINILFQQERCKRVPEHMRGYMYRYTARLTIRINHTADGLLCQPFAIFVYKKISAVRDFFRIDKVIIGKNSEYRLSKKPSISAWLFRQSAITIYLDLLLKE